MKSIKIVSDGTTLGVKLFDEEGNDITRTAGNKCLGIEIKLCPGEHPLAVFTYRALPLEITARKIDEFDSNSPIESVFYWKGKPTKDMTAEDIKDCYDWCDRHPGEDKTGFLSAVQRRYTELNAYGLGGTK